MPRTHRTARTNEELVANSVHVLYSIQMFAGTARLISAAPRTSDGLTEEERIQVLALIESQLTHARALMRFLYPTIGARATDILAEDYVDDGRPLPPPWSNFETDLRQIDQELAHLSYNRSSGVVTWGFAPALSAALRAFLELAAEDRLRPEFQGRRVGGASQSVESRTTDRRPPDALGSVMITVRNVRVHAKPASASERATTPE